MTQKVIHHSLRDIVLAYDESIVEQELEKQLIQSYLKLHDSSEIIINRFFKLYYEYKTGEDLINETAKALTPIEDTVDKYHKEIRWLLKEKFLKKTDDEIQKRKWFLASYYNNVKRFREELAEPLTDKLNSLGKEYEEFEDDEEKWIEEFGEHDKLEHPFYSGYSKYSLDLVAYDIDENNFRERLPEFQEKRVEMSNIHKAFHKLLDRINVNFEKWCEIIAMIDN